LSFSAAYSNISTTHLAQIGISSFGEGIKLMVALGHELAHLSLRAGCGETGMAMAACIWIVKKVIF
jgi:hypothetical protein